MKYKIKTINDLFKVPRDLRATCLAELLQGINETEDFLLPKRAKVPWFLKWMLNPKLRQIIWIDDGKTFIEIRNPITGKVEHRKN